MGHRGSKRGKLTVAVRELTAVLKTVFLGLYTFTSLLNKQKHHTSFTHRRAP